MLIDPVIPLLWISAIALVMSAATIWHYWRSARHLSVFKAIFLLLLRLGGIAIVILLLLQPYREEKSNRHRSNASFGSRWMIHFR